MVKRYLLRVILIVSVIFLNLKNVNAIDIPANLKAGATEDRITITWTTVDGATAYELEADGQIIYSGEENYFEHIGLNTYEEHTYRVRALQGDEYSNWSEVYNQTTAKDRNEQIEYWLYKNGELTEPRHGLGVVVIENDIYILGGYGNGYCQWIEKYDNETQQWDMIGQIPEGIYNPAIVASDNKIYIIGGYHKEKGAMNSVYIYNPIDNTWQEGQQMLTPRSHMIGVYYEDMIYVVGGYNHGSGALDTVEVYDIQKDEWTSIEKMPTARSRLAAVVKDDLIYVFGGFNRGYQGEIETYNLNTGEWEQVGYMPIPRHSMSVVNIKDHIFILGGYNTTAFDTVEEYHTEDNTFNYQENMNHARYDFGTAVTDDTIYILGGTDEGKSLGDVEYAIFYKPEPPENIQYSTDGEDVYLNWDKIDDQIQYELEKDGELLLLGFDTSFIDDNPIKNKQHVYRIRGKSIATGIWSDTIKVIIWSDNPAASLVTLNDVYMDSIDEKLEVALRANQLEDTYTIYGELSYDSDKLTVYEEELSNELWKNNEDTYFSIKVDKEVGKVFFVLSRTGIQEGFSGDTDIINFTALFETLNKTSITIDKLQFVNPEGVYVEVEYSDTLDIGILETY